MDERTTVGLAQRRQYPRRKGSAEMKVCSLHEWQWKPPSRQAAKTLSACLRSAKSET